MVSRQQLALETLIVGVTFFLLFFFIHLGFMKLRRDAMQHHSLFLQVFLAGALGHLFFEVLGLNDKFCAILR
jgi:hypothetical protein